MTSEVICCNGFRELQKWSTAVILHLETLDLLWIILSSEVSCEVENCVLQLDSKLKRHAEDKGFLASKSLELKRCGHRVLLQTQMQNGLCFRKNLTYLWAWDRIYSYGWAWMSWIRIWYVCMCVKVRMKECNPLWLCQIIILYRNKCYKRSTLLYFYPDKIYEWKTSFNNMNIT